MYVSVRHSLILPLETNWETTFLVHQVEMEWWLKLFLSTYNPLVLNFSAPWYTYLFLNSKNYIAHVINCEWSRSINFPLRLFCITCFVSFGIKDGTFLMLEDSALNFLHGYWNYCLMKIDIDIIMSFKFDIKYVKLNFKAIC